MLAFRGDRLRSLQKFGIVQGKHFLDLPGNQEPAGGTEFEHVLPVLPDEADDFLLDGNGLLVILRLIAAPRLHALF